MLVLVGLIDVSSPQQDSTLRTKIYHAYDLEQHSKQAPSVVEKLAKSQLSQPWVLRTILPKENSKPKPNKHGESPKNLLHSKPTKQFLFDLYAASGTLKNWEQKVKTGQSRQL